MPNLHSTPFSLLLICSFPPSLNFIVPCLPHVITNWSTVRQIRCALRVQVHRNCPLIGGFHVSESITAHTMEIRHIFSTIFINFLQDNFKSRQLIIFLTSKSFCDTNAMKLCSTLGCPIAFTIHRADLHRIMYSYLMNTSFHIIVCNYLGILLSLHYKVVFHKSSG